MYLRQLEPQIPYPFDDAVERRLVVNPASKTGLVRTGRGHFETFERSHNTYAEPSADDQLVFSPLRGRGLAPTGGRTGLGHTLAVPTVGRWRTKAAEPTKRVLKTTMETSCRPC